MFTYWVCVYGIPVSTWNPIYDRIYKCDVNILEFFIDNLKRRILTIKEFIQPFMCIHEYNFCKKK